MSGDSLPAHRGTAPTLGAPVLPVCALHDRSARVAALEWPDLPGSLRVVLACLYVRSWTGSLATH
jgi:hypothetical protein